MAKQYIGEREVVEVVDTEKTTAGGVNVKEVRYKDGTAEQLSELMLEATLSSKKVDLTDLRDARVHPVVAATLAVWRDWGINVNEVNYICTILGESINKNGNAAITRMWAEKGAVVSEPSAVSLITIDEVLRDSQE